MSIANNIVDSADCGGLGSIEALNLLNANSRHTVAVSRRDHKPVFDARCAVQRVRKQEIVCRGPVRERGVSREVNRSDDIRCGGIGADHAREYIDAVALGREQDAVDVRCCAGSEHGGHVRTRADRELLGRKQLAKRGERE